MGTMKKVCIDPGHGGTDSGASFRGLAEKDVVFSVGQLLSEEMSLTGYLPMLTRDSDVFIPLPQRATLANDFGADIFLSLHCNADPDSDAPGMPEAKGEEIWYYARSQKGLQLAEALAATVDFIFPYEPFRGVKQSSGLYVLKHTLMPAALVELGFIDNSETNEQFDKKETIERIVYCLQLGIAKYFGEIDE